MKLKLLLSFVLCIHIMYTSAQTTTNAKYSQNEYKTFAKIYKHTLDNPFDIVAATKKNIKQITLSEERLSEILQAQFSGKDVRISNTELKQLKKLQSLLKQEQDIYNKKLNQFIVVNKMTPSKYKEIRIDYSKIDNVRNQVNKLSARN